MMRAARRAIRPRLMPPEIVRLELPAICLLHEGDPVAWRDVLLAITDEHLIWVDSRRPKSGAMSLRHDEVLRASYDGQMLGLIKRDPSFPRGERTSWFSFVEERGVWVRTLPEARLGRLDP